MNITCTQPRLFITIVYISTSMRKHLSNQTKQKDGVKGAGSLAERGLRGGTESFPLLPPSLLSHPFLSLILALVAVVLYLPVIRNDFISYDDINYVVENPAVKAGLTLNGIMWAMKSVYFANWHPATWILYMTEAQVFGVSPQGFHLVSLILHAVNGVLLFRVLCRLMKKAVPAFLGALLFVVHPINVESVAWVSQQKTLLSTTFWFFSLITYITYVEKQKVFTYIAVTVFFIIGLMAKPMLVTLPVTLLILDFYPLQRVGGVSLNEKLKVIYEKIPLFVISIAASVVTAVSQKQSGAIVAISSVSVSERLINAVTSYAGYIKKMLYPVNLSVFYPIMDTVNFLTAGTDIFMLIVITATAVVFIKRAPYVAAGFLWYVVTLLPVSQIVQIGGASLSDRYAYVPLIGLFATAAAFACKQVYTGKLKKYVVVVGLLIVVIALSYMSVKQLSYWRDSGTLFKHSTEVTTGNYVACNEYGMYLKDKGDIDGAVEMFRRGLSYAPGSRVLHFNMWDALLRKGDTDEAQKHLYIALSSGDSAENLSAIKDLGVKLLKQHNYALSAAYFSVVISLSPKDADGYNYLGLSYLGLKEYDKAKLVFQRGLKIYPDRSDFKFHMGLATKALTENDTK
ncbi:MAG: tetratricopeptide repeat protein [Nitrospirae bacterium YQR-1]